MQTKKEIAIIGGGIIGLSCARELALRGHHVKVLDENPGTDLTGCSYGNAGMVVPSHIIPLASPGVIAKGVRWLMNSQSPLYINPKPSPAMMKWLWNFYKACKAKNSNKLIPTLAEIGLLSRDLFSTWKGELDFTLEELGLVMLYQTHKAEKEEQELAGMAHEYGMNPRSLSTMDLKRLEPDIEINALGGIIYPQDAHLDPEKLMGALRENVNKLGVEVIRGVKVKKVKHSGNKISTIETDEGSHTAEEFVLAAGTWSTDLASSLKLSLPIQPGKGYSMTLRIPSVKIKTPMILTEAKVSVTPLGDKIRFGGTMELGNRHPGIHHSRVEGIVRSVHRYFPGISTDEFKKVQVWSGFRPCSPDGLPYIGRFSRYPNLIAASGHAMLGVSLAPVTGNLVAGIVEGSQPPFSIEALSPDRFSR